MLGNSNFQHMLERSMSSELAGGKTHPTPTVARFSTCTTVSKIILILYPAFSNPMIRYLAMFSVAFAAATASLIPPLVVQDDVQPIFNAYHDIKVPVELGVMSRCPDALLCEFVFDQVLHQVANKVDLALRYVAKCVVMEFRHAGRFNLERLGSNPQNPSTGSNACTDHKNALGMCSNFALPSIHRPTGLSL